MVRYILKQWFTKKATLMLIIVGFIIATLVLSIGTSVYKNNMDETKKRIATMKEEGIEESSNLVVVNNNDEYSTVKNMIIITAISSTLIFSVALINIINLMIYWIIERKKEFAIIKALGGTNSYIKKIVTTEVVFITVISAILAVIIQGCIDLCFKDTLAANEIVITVTYRNYVIAIGVAIICGLIASLVPTEKAIESSIVEVLGEE